MATATSRSIHDPSFFTILVIAAACVACWSLPSRSRGQDHRLEQEQAIDKILKTGGAIERDETRPGKPVRSLHLTSFKDDFLLKQLGAWETLVSLDLARAPVDGKALACLDKMTNLRSLSFGFSTITDADAAQFKTPASLRVADFLGTHITGTSLRCLRNSRQLTVLLLGNCRGVRNAGLEQLKVLTELQTVDLSGTRVHDAGMTHLRSLINLRALSLDDTEITDAGLENLSALLNLEDLCLSNTQLHDVGMKYLRLLANLQTLSLDGTGITDAGLDDLLGLEKLEELSLTKTQVTDAGMARLKAMKQLDTLCLSETRVTDAGLTALRDLPKLEILELDESQLTEVGLRNLRALPHLKEIYPIGPHVNADFARKMKAELPGVEIDLFLREFPRYNPPTGVPGADSPK